MKTFLSLCFSSLLFTACTFGLPMTMAEGEAKTEAFLLLMKSDPQSAYLQTDVSLQEKVGEPAFIEYANTSPYIQDLADITITSISSESAAYSTTYDGPYSIVTLTGTADFRDGSITPFVANWLYSETQETWLVSGIDFAPGADAN